MPRGISIHVGLNEIDPGHYGTNGALRGCENDARAMQAIAAQFGFESTTILTRQATAAKLLLTLKDAGPRLSDGDILFLSYAGHGSQVRDTANEESDGVDETWCLYDRMLLDDELYGFWSTLRPGVRVLMVSDSCHSATVSRFLDALEESKEQSELRTPVSIPRGFPIELAEEVVANNRNFYESLKYSAPRDLSNQISATVLLLAACQDNQTAGDGAKNGLFTGALLKTWDKGRFKGTYKQLLAGSGGQLTTQTPNYSVIGAPNSNFESQLPFTISGSRPGLSPTVGPPAPVDDRDGLSIDERLARVKAAYKSGSRALNGHSEPGCTFEIGIDRSFLDQMSEADVYNFLRSEGCDVLMKAYLRVGVMALPRGGDGGLSCRINESGGIHCTGGINIRF